MTIDDNMPQFRAYCDNFNGPRIESTDVIPYLVSEYDRKYGKRKSPQTYAEFKEFVEKELMYRYWSRCQYEVIISDGQNEGHKIDVYEQVRHNLDLVCVILYGWLERTKHKLAFGHEDLPEIRTFDMMVIDPGTHNVAWSDIAGWLAMRYRSVYGSDFDVDKFFALCFLRQDNWEGKWDFVLQDWPNGKKLQHEDKNTQINLNYDWIEIIVRTLLSDGK